jgi:hypothetical protein
MQALERIDISNNWLTLTYLFMLLLLLLLKTISSNKLFGYTRAFLLKGFIAKKAEERASFFTGFNLVMFVFSILTFGLFFLYVFRYIDQEFEFSFYQYLWLTIFVAAYFVFFLIMDFALSRLLNIQEVVAHFIAAKIGYLYNTALLLFPFLIIHTYSFFSVYLLFGVFITLFLLSLVLIFTNNKNLIINKLFYFILYLCALEIAPLLIIYKITV